MRRVRTWTIALFITFAAATAAPAAQETDASGESEIVKSRPDAITADPGQTADQQYRLETEFARIERAYMSVVKYYNKNLTDAEALHIARLVLYHSAQFRLEPRLMMAVIAAESGFNPGAVSPKGAMGLGQLMPGTARLVGVKKPFDPHENIYGTACYLRKMYDRWAGEEDVLDLMLASYNAGPEAVARYNGVPPYRETIGYVRKVKKLFRFFVYGY